MHTHLYSHHKVFSSQNKWNATDVLGIGILDISHWRSLYLGAASEVPLCSFLLLFCCLPSNRPMAMLETIMMRKREKRMPSGISTTLISSMNVSHCIMAKTRVVYDDLKCSGNLKMAQAFVLSFLHHIMKINCRFEIEEHV